ncbi:hypothetical protein BU15DRAFT_29863, partial [Melanogaster broomeanus]
VITSPNMTFIPKPFLFEKAELRPLRDGRFGVIDVFQWPQLHSDQFAFSACIPRKSADSDNDAFALLWWTPSTAEFVKEKGCVYDIGRLSSSMLQSFALLHLCLLDLVHNDDALLSKYPQLRHNAQLRSLQYAMQRLEHYPLTFRELLLQVAEYQRIGLDLVAYINFVQAIQKPSRKVNTKFMGAFTGNPDTCQKYFNFGFPVWFIR